MISQGRYIRKILKKAEMEDSKPVSMPMDPGVALYENEVKKDENDTHTSIEYAACVGELLYAMHATRPDILYATVTLTQYTSNLSPRHWTTLKQVFRYL